MALQKRTDVETSELKGVVLAVDETKVKPGVFVRLSNWKPSGIGSIKKKRGVLALDTIANIPIEPVEDCNAAVSATAPIAPGNLVATTVDFFSISLTWDDNSSDETNFSIERCSGIGCTNFIPVATVGQDEISYVDSFLDPDTAYSYRVLAYNQAGVSSYSNTDTATTDALPPEPPSVDLALWLDAVQIGLSDDSPVDEWLDESGAGNDFVAILTSRPTFKTTGPLLINSLPVVSFDGIDDLLNNNSLDTSAWTGATMFIVGRGNADPAVAASKSGHWKFNSYDANAHFPFVDGVVYENIFTTIRKTIGDLTTAIDQPTIYTIVSQDGDYRVRLNRVEVFSTTTNTFVGQNGGNLLGGSESFFYNGVIGEVVLIEGVLTDSDIIIMEAILATKWNL